MAAGWCRLIESQNRREVPCLGSAGDEPGRTSAGGVPQAAAPGEAPPAQSGAEQGRVGLPWAASGLEEEGWEEGCLVGLSKVGEAGEEEEGEAAEEESRS